MKTRIGPVAALDCGAKNPARMEIKRVDSAGGGRFVLGFVVMTIFPPV